MPRTLVDILKARAENSPDQLAYLFLIDGETEGPRLTYAQLHDQARSIAAALAQVADEQQRAMLIYPPGLDFIAAFFACLYAGVIAVPVYPPKPDFLRPGSRPLARFAADCRPAVILATASMLRELKSAYSGCSELEQAAWIATDELEQPASIGFHPPDIDEQSLALLQYTSGSTAQPRGVMITHANLLHNEQTIQAAFEHRGPGMGVCWLPQYHDMGLLGGVIQSIYHDSPNVLMSPLSFLQQPYRWLAAISKYRADTSGGPNLAYDLCVQRVTPEQRRTLDLSRWSVAAIGAETIRPETLEQFSETFAECGFRHEAFYPCYGLAEATVFVTGGRKSEAPRIRAFDRAELQRGSAVEVASQQDSALRLVSCGWPWGDQKLAIVDPESCRECPAGSIGEIWLAGSSVAKGYWNSPAETAETFSARVQDTNQGPMLRSGDLGFLHEGQLYITGRLKDLIVIHGRSHAPQDIEETVQAVHPGLRVGCGAAFEIERDGKPRLVVVQEVDRRCRELDDASLTGEVRQAISERHELHLYELVLLDHASIPRTSSGKVRRHACRKAYDEAELRLWKGPRQ